MNPLESILYKTRKTLREACTLAGINFDEAIVEKLQECTSCNIWETHTQIVQDLDDNPICMKCYQYYGL